MFHNTHCLLPRLGATKRDGKQVSSLHSSAARMRSMLSFVLAYRNQSFHSSTNLSCESTREPCTSLTAQGLKHSRRHTGHTGRPQHCHPLRDCICLTSNSFYPTQLSTAHPAKVVTPLYHSYTSSGGPEPSATRLICHSRAFQWCVQQYHMLRAPQQSRWPCLAVGPPASSTSTTLQSKSVTRH
jgi:hypothetical protein